MSMVEGPYFDDLAVGDVIETAPSMTLTAARAAVHQSILGGRLRLSLDEHLARATSGVALADPAFVWDVAIGQSALVTRRVVANLFYRGLAFRRMPALGDTLSTRTEVVGLRQSASRPVGLAALRITTSDQRGRTVLDFWRCAMLPLSSPAVRTGHVDDLGAIGDPPQLDDLMSTVGDWDLEAFPLPSPGLIEPGARWSLDAGDVVSNAPELARLTLNLAHVHHDAYARDTGRLVYGGHTIGLALGQVTRTLPDILTIGGWHGCDHTGPVYEGDTLYSVIDVEQVQSVSDAVRAVTLRVEMSARRNAESHPVLDWRLIALSR